MGLRLKDVSYGKTRDFNYEFKEGKVTSVIYPQDEKYEFLGKIMSGLEDCYEGKVINDYKGNNIRYIYKNPNDMFGENSVSEELSIALKKFNYTEITINKKINDVLRIVNLENILLDKELNSLSSGEKKLLSIAMALITNPKIIIIDSPLDGLDYINKKNIIKVLRKIAKRYNKIIIIFTSDIIFSYDICDEYIFLKNGNIADKGTKKDLINIDKKIKNTAIYIPKIIDFVLQAKKTKNISLEKTFDVKELMKDVYRNAR